MIKKKLKELFYTWARTHPPTHSPVWNPKKLFPLGRLGCPLQESGLEPAGAKFPALDGPFPPTGLGGLGGGERDAGGFGEVVADDA